METDPRKLLAMQPAKKRTPLEQDNELTSSVFQQPGMPTPRPMMDFGPTGGTPKSDTSHMQRPAATGQGYAQLPGTQAPPKGNFDFSTLVGGGVGGSMPRAMGAAQQRNTAPPLQDTTNAAAGGGQTTRIDHRTYTGPDDLNKIQPGAPVSDRPGMVWQHDGQGWLQMPAGATPPGNPTQPQGDPRFSWMQSQPYVPGQVGTDDMPAFSWESLLGAMGPDYTPTNVQGGNLQVGDVSPEDFATYDFQGWHGLPGMDVGAVGGMTDDLIQRILQNPESLGPREIAMMQAAGREEQSALGAQADDEMRALGFEMGISDSPWMAAERLQGRRDRDAAVIGSNRNIEIEAAKTNAGDRRAAGALGASYVDSKGRLQLAQRDQSFREQSEGERMKQASTQSKQARAEYLTGVKSANADRQLEVAKVRMQADIANNENLFNAAKLRQDKVLGTVDADLKRAAATTDRLVLRESIAQAAADLGLSKDKLMADWLKALMDDATQRYGIDVAKEVDLKKLDQAGSEFKEDLAFRIMALDKEMGYKYATLGESGRQFDYNLGLGYSELQQRANESDNDFYARSQGF